MQASVAVEAEPGVRPHARLGPAQLLLALVAVAFAIRLTGLASRPLWLDEAFTAWFSSRSWLVLWTEVPAYEVHPPFYASLVKLWRGLWGSDPAALRSLSLILSVLAVPVVFAAALAHEKLEPSEHGLLRAGAAAFLVALSPSLIWHGQEARPYALLVLGYALAVLGLLQVAQALKAQDAGRWKPWLLLGAGTELVLWSHSLGILYASCLLLAALCTLRAASATKADWRRLILVVAVTGLVYAPCLLIVASQSSGWSSTWLTWNPALLIQLVTLYAVPYKLLSAATVPAVIVMLVLFKRVLGFGFAAAGGWRPTHSLLMLWLGPPLITILTSMAIVPVFMPRTLLPTLIPAYLLVATAIARAGARERLILGAIGGLSLSIAAMQTALRPPLEAWDEVSTYLDRNVAPGDQVWLYPNDSSLPLGDVMRRLGHHYPMRQIPGDYPALTFKGPVRAATPAVPSVAREQARALAADPSLRTVRRIWLVTRQDDVFDPKGDVPAALAAVRSPGAQREWGPIKVRPYELR